MLLEFSAANFRSINQRVTLSMVAQSISDTPKENYTIVEGAKVLKSAVVYGANSSGKSNVLLSMGAMYHIVQNSVKLNFDDKIHYQPFLLTTEKDKPSLFEVVFVMDGTKYRYGFEATSQSVEGEWLFKSSLKSKDEKALFVRSLEGIGVDESIFGEGVGNEEKTADNRLFLSLCAQLSGKISQKIMGWLLNNFYIISGLEGENYQGLSKIMLHQNQDGCDRAKDFFQTLQLGFNELETIEKEFDISNMPHDMPVELKNEFAKNLKGKKNIELFTHHAIYDNEGRKVGVDRFSMDYMESEGTKKMIQLSGPIFKALENGKILIVDELDAKMHPLISHYIIKLFNDPRTNPKNAQLIFTTHDTNLLSSNLFRRDQIWFTEKDSAEQTDLYNMMDIVLPDGSKPRNDANYEKNYIAGRYGAIPYILNK